MKHALLLFLLLAYGLAQAALPPHYFERYSTEDGLPQQSVFNILQDKRGFMWFGTWNGFCKYDGYEFIAFNMQQNSYNIKSSRIGRMFEDRYGHIWFQSYDGEAHRFDPQTETFRGIQIEDFPDFPFFLSKLEVKLSGKAWLLSNRTGAICVLDSTFKTVVYGNDTDPVRGKHINSVFEDTDFNSWLLTDNGLVLIPSNNEKESLFFAEKENENAALKQSFFSVIELEEEIWFGTNSGKIWIYSKIDRQFNLFDFKTTSHIIKFIELPDKTLAIVTAQNGIYLYDRFKKQLQNFAVRGNFANNKLVSAYNDSRGNIWLSMDCLGALKFDFKSRRYTFFPHKSDIVNEQTYSSRFFIAERGDMIFVHPKGGSFSYYNAETNELIPFFNIKSEREWRLANMLHMAYFDRQGNMWICTRQHGVEKIVFDKNRFQPNVLNHNRFGISNEVRAVFEDSNHNLWISGKDNRLRIYDKNRNFLGFLNNEGFVTLRPATLSSIVYCITQDDKQNIWLGTRGNGIYRLVPVSHNTLAFRVSNFQNNPGNIYSLSNNSVYSIFQDSKKNIWIGSFDGGLNLVKESDNGKIVFINHRNRLKNYPIDNAYRIRCIGEDAFGNICIGTTNGLLMFKSKSVMPENIEYKHYTRIQNNKNSLGSNDLQFILNTGQGDMYITSSGGGITKTAGRDKDGFPSAFTSFTVQNGLPSNVTLSIVEDRTGKLWITTENNLVKFDPEKETFETFGEIKRLMSTGNFSEASNIITHTGEILFGYSNGLLSFFPDEIKKNSFKPRIAFERFKLFNKNVPVGKNNSPLQKNIDYTDKLILTHKQNFFSIEYAALDFIDPQNIQYAYKLAGFDKDWNYVQNGRIANYTNLPRGKYIFCVKSTNSDGIWVHNERQLPIEILPSFWETIWAYLLYFLLFVAFIFVIVKVLLVFYHLKDKMKMEEELSELKLQFFTDISHEIRTPLTMITAPIEHMQSDERTPSFIRKQLELISNNTNRILRLVNQILDFRKMEYLNLKVTETEISPFVQSLCTNFDEIAHNRNIRFSFTGLAHGEKIWVDRDALDKIVYNLLSNAFKYTPEGKSIAVTVCRETDGTVSLEVRDEGIGIPKEMQKKLFDRFVSFNKDKSKPSAGIGLSLVKYLADKHRATILVESEINKGSSFKIIFRLGLNHFSKNVEIEFDKTIETQNAASPQKTPNPTTDIEKTNARPSILIVEDDHDLRSFIRSILMSEYEIIEAADGEEAYQLAQTTIPDFVVSDIMMPKIDGVQLLQKLKNNLNTSHIPVVLLTAKTTIESKLQGLQYGADDYITKPFSVVYFRARIENLLKQRAHLQQLYCSNLFASGTVVELQKPQITLHDDAFVEKIIRHIEENMDNPEFSVEDLAVACGTSRTVFFKKLKSLTGLAPVEFIRDIKIKRAAQLLSTGQFLVKETGYMIGMTDSKYFNKCFKAKYGMTPSEYRDKAKK